MKDIKVTVVTPTFNRGDLLARAVKSVLAQTHPNVEMIIVDDNPAGSEARIKTKEVIDKINDGRVIYLENEKNSGPSISRNNGIARATGEYITFLDDDDEYMETKVEEQLSFMMENDLDLCFCDGAIFTPDGRLLQQRKKNLPLGLDKTALMKKHLIDHLTGTNKMMFRASFLHTIGGFDDVAAAEEYYLTEKAINAGAKIGNIDHPLTRTIMHSGKHITTSNTKIITENQLFERKKKYFSILTRKEIRQVKVRHYATLGFAHLKCRHYFKCMLSCIMGMLVSPVEFVRVAMQNRKKI